MRVQTKKMKKKRKNRKLTLPSIPGHVLTVIMPTLRANSLPTFASVRKSMSQDLTNMFYLILVVNIVRRERTKTAITDPAI